MKKQGKVIIVEGLLVLAFPELCELIDLKIFIDVAADIRFIRRLQRDIRKRNRSVDSVVSQYLKTAGPMHMKFVEPTKKYADITVPDAVNTMVIEMIISVIQNKIREVK